MIPPRPTRIGPSEAGLIVRQGVRQAKRGGPSEARNESRQTRISMVLLNDYGSPTLSKEIPETSLVVPR